MLQLHYISSIESRFLHIIYKFSFFPLFFNDFWNEKKIIKNEKSKNQEDFIFWAEASRKYENPEVFPKIGKTWQLCKNFLQKPLLFCYNNAAIQFTNFKAENVRNRYIDIKYKFVHELYNNGWFDILHISTKDNVANILTKSLPKVAFLKFQSSYLADLWKEYPTCVPHESVTKRPGTKNDNPDFFDIPKKSLLKYDCSIKRKKFFTNLGHSIHWISFSYALHFS